MKNIYYDDFRCCEIHTTVRDVKEEAGFYWHSFERTIFYVSDTYEDEGYINQCEVLRLKNENGIVYHLLEQKLEGDVFMTIDRRKRYIQAQNETLALLMNEVMQGVYHYDNLDYYITDYYMVSRFKGKPLTRQQKNELQISLNGMIRDDYPVKVSYHKISDERSVKIGLFSDRKNDRIQVPSLKFIQMVNILEIISKEDEFIVVSTCGDQLLLTLDCYHEIIKETSTLLQCEPLFINTSIHEILNKIKKM